MPQLIRQPAAFALYVIVASVTPGPNNLMLVNVGIVRGSLSAVRTGLGVSCGWAIQILACALGIGAAVRAVPGLSGVIEVAGLAYLVWLAVRLLGSRELGKASPMHGFAGAIGYQWVNPKAVTMSLTTAGIFVVTTGGHAWLSALAVAVAAALLNLPCVLLWGLGGARLSTLLQEEAAVVRFHRIAAGALFAMVAWLVVVRVVG